MFATLRNAIANVLRTKQEVQVTAAVGTYNVLPEHMRTQGARAAMPAIKGEFSIAHLDFLKSERLKQAICSLGSWSAIARAFNQFNRQLDLPESRRNFDQVHKLTEEFHTWNAHSNEQMDDDATLAVIAKLTDAVVPRGNKETDKIIARIRKCSVDDIKAERIEKALSKQRKQEGHVEGFNSYLWANIYGDDENFSIPVAKVVMKAFQTMEWIASWDAYNPEEQAADLLLIEADIKFLEKLGATKNDNDTKEFEYATRSFGQPDSSENYRNTSAE